jgi:hypothetical protein
MNQLPPITLSPDQIVSRSMIEARIGTPPRRLLIFTGIAVPGFESNGQVDGVEVTVYLDAISNVPNPSFTATVGLASIYNNSRDLLFATDDVRVVTGPDLELLLKCNIAVLGHPSSLARFSYQAMVMLHPENGTVAGTIRWNPHFLTFAGDEHDLFQIDAYATRTVSVGAPEDNIFVNKVVKVEKAGVGVTIGSVVREGVRMAIPYEIDNLPMGEPILVSVFPKPDAFLVTNSQLPFEFVRTSGPVAISLSDAHPIEKPVDFEARQVEPGLH